MKRPLIVFLFLCFGWKFVNSEDTSSVDCNLFKVRTEDTSESSGYKENDSSKYDYEVKGLLKNQPLYKFKTGTKFLALLYNDEFVWQHSSAHDHSKFPTELEIDPFNKTLWIKYGGMDFLTFKFDDNKWKHSEDLSYGDCKRVKIPDYNADSPPTTPASPPAEEKEREEAEKSEEEAEETEEKPTEEESGDGDVKTEDPEDVEKPEEKTVEEPEVADSKEDAKEADDKTEDPAEARGADAEEANVAPEEDEASKPAEAGTDADASSESEATPLAGGGEASSATDTTPEVTVPAASEGDTGTVLVETHTEPLAGEDSSSLATTADDVAEAPDATAAPQVHGEDASKADVPDSGKDAGLETEGEEAKGDDVLLGNLYPSDLTGAFHSALRGTLFDENVKAEPEKKESEEAEKAPEESDVSTAPDAKPADEAEEKEEKGQKEDEKATDEGATPSAETATVAEPSAEGDESSKAADADATTTPEPNATPVVKTESLTLLGGRYKMLGTKADGTEGELLDDDLEVEGDSDHVTVNLKTDVKMKELQFKRTDFDSFEKHWEHEHDKHGDSHPKVLRFDVPKSLVTLEFGERWFYKYNFGGMRPELELSKAPLEPSKKPDLKLFKLDHANAEKEMEAEDYHLVRLVDSANGQFNNFEFDDGTKLVKLEYNNEEVWRHEPAANADNYPKYVAVNSVSKDLRVFVDDGLKFDFEFDTTQNKYLTEADKGGKKVASGKMEHEGKHLKVFTLSDDESTEEEDKEGKYDLELENKVLLAKFREGVKCVKLEYNSNEVWKHDTTKHGNKYPTEVKFDTQTLEVVLSFEDMSKFTYKYDGKSSAHAFALSTVPLDTSERPANLKFFKDEDGNDEIGNADLSLSKESDGTKEFVVHRFGDLVKCHVVKYGNNDVWEYDTDYQDNYPASVHYNTTDHELRVFVRTNWFYFYKYDADKNGHDIYREKEPAEFTSE